MTNPYNGTEGSSGTETSAARAERNASSAKHREQQMLHFLRTRTVLGATVTEAKNVAAFNDDGSASARVALPIEFRHHGTASATLSILHRSGKIARLAETRNGAKVYVLPEFIDDRPYERFVGNRERAQIAILDQAITSLEEQRASLSPVDRLGVDVATAHLRGMLEALVAGV